MNFLDNGITGHRGNPVEYPENTLPSFADAVAAGVDWIELDVRLSSDNRLIVIHDGTTGRTCDADLLIEQTDSGKLRKLNAASGWNRANHSGHGRKEVLPFLEEVLELIKTQNRTRVSIQPKVDCVTEICAMLKKMNLTEYAGFNDGDLSVLQKAVTLLPGAAVFYDLHNRQDTIAAIMAAKHYNFTGIVQVKREVCWEDV